MLLEHARVNREVVDALLRLMFKRGEDDLFVKVFELFPDNHRVNRHGADGDRRGLAERFATFIKVSTGGEVHHGVRAPLLCPLQFLDFFVRA